MHIVTKALLALTLTDPLVAAESALVDLGNRAAYPSADADVLAAVEDKLRNAGRQPEDYHARVETCDPDACAIAVFSRDVVADPRQGGVTVSCPGEYCVTMTYAKKSKSISRVVRWK